MTKPNEEVNEELSTDELKSVSGGSPWDYSGGLYPTGKNLLKRNGPEGSGYGGTRRDWEKSQTFVDGGEGHDLQ
ncbi:Hypothetical protein PMT_2897 [Prochlorococcus marinus str. MIT 9313]|uniref:Bacteriocin-type signal sequence n=1 Tax=Prochlorococcus marinus (strain MIT 9313) TaxID=74547 RepID=B9ESR1_PROMM|nr:bacteriocin [Prochlorococcus marinus]CAX32415.1 Hypothetical protein PMT_2897 [Prochlorococcus marinus str. MIT 9313]